MQALERLYYDYYSNHNISQNIYIGQRIRVYQNIYAILKDLNIKSLLDIGCSFGLLVDICNAQEINAVGLDLPIDSLKHFHQNLKYSANKFLYDSVDNGDNFDIFRDKAFDAITIIDSLRYFGHPEFIKKINATFIIIKEVSNNLYIRKYRKNAKIPDFRLYSPIALLNIFNNYEPMRIYLPKFFLKINNPSKIILKMINFLPTYTIVL